MTGSIKDVEYLSCGAFCPILIKAFSEAPVDILRGIPSTTSTSGLNKILDLIDILCEVLN